MPVISPYRNWFIIHSTRSLSRIGSSFAPLKSNVISSRVSSMARVVRTLPRPLPTWLSIARVVGSSMTPDWRKSQVPDLDGFLLRSPCRHDVDHGADPVRDRD